MCVFKISNVQIIFKAEFVKRKSGSVIFKEEVKSNKFSFNNKFKYLWVAREKINPTPVFIDYKTHLVCTPFFILLYFGV